MVAQFERTNARDFEVDEWFGDWFRQFERGYRFNIEEVHGIGDRVLLDATHHGHGRRSGVTVEQRTLYLYTLRDAQITRIEVWADGERESAFEAAGLRE